MLTGVGIDEVWSRTEDGNTTTFLPDALGSTVALSSSSGAIQTQYTYAPFGETTVSGAASTNPFQYTGRENDGTTDLYYYRARYYHPTLQRFISEDPIGFAGGDVNLYAYVTNNPLRAIDPLGLTQADIDQMLNLARDTQIDLNIPDTVGVTDLFGDNLGFTNPLTKNIWLDDRYLKPLDLDGLRELYEAIVHESIHRTRPRSDMIRRPFKHPDIYNDARRRLEEQDFPGSPLECR